MRCGYDYAKSVEGWSAEEDIIGRGRFNDEETNRDCLGLSTIAENGMEIDVATGGDLFPCETICGFIVWNHGGGGELEFLIRCRVEDVDRTALVNEDFLDDIIFQLNRDTSAGKGNDSGYFQLLAWVRNRGIYGRGKKVVLYASVTNPRHI